MLEDPADFREAGGKTMERSKVTKAGQEAKDGSNAADHAETAVDANEPADETTDTLVATVATVGVVGVGVAVLEAALLPGVVLGSPPCWPRNLCRRLAPL